MLFSALVWLTAVGGAQQLEVNYQRSPALGVGPALRFSWSVPPPSDASGVQSAYRIVIRGALDAAVEFDSGVVRSSASINVALDAKAAGLQPGRAYAWTVACDGGAPSAPARFVTALWSGFASGAEFIWAADLSGAQHFAALRHTVAPRAAGVDAPRSAIVEALLFVAAWQEPTMLAAFKVYVDGALVAIGPGRGEADVLSHNATFRYAPYATVDVSPLVREGSVVAVGAMAPLFQTPCKLHACTDYNGDGGGVLLQLSLRYGDGTARTIVTRAGAAHGWSAAPFDAYYRPTPPAVRPDPAIAGLAAVGETAYAKILEHIDAAAEGGWGRAPLARAPFRRALAPTRALLSRARLSGAPSPAPAHSPRPRRGPARARAFRAVVGWRTAAAGALVPAWPPAASSRYQRAEQLFPKMARPLVVYAPPPPRVARAEARADEVAAFLVDFTRNFQGGLSFAVGAARGGARAGRTVRIMSGELLLPNGAVDNRTLSRLDPANTWGYAFNWTLRSGAQMLTQHGASARRAALKCSLVVSRRFLPPSLYISIAILTVLLVPRRMPR